MSEENYGMAEEISKAMQDKKHLKETARILKKIFDGEPKNINPIKEMPEPDLIQNRS